MYEVESTDPYSAHPHVTDERIITGNVDVAAQAFAELTGWTEDDAREALAEGDITWTDPETGREFVARRETAIEVHAAEMGAFAGAVV